MVSYVAYGKGNRELFSLVDSNVKTLGENLKRCRLKRIIVERLVVKTGPRGGTS